MEVGFQRVHTWLSGKDSRMTVRSLAFKFRLTVLGAITESKLLLNLIRRCRRPRTPTFILKKVWISLPDYLYQEVF